MAIAKHGTDRALSGTPSSGLSVCHVLFSMEVGGAESLVLSLAKRRSARTQIVVTDTYGDLARECRASGIPIELIPRKAPNSINALASFLQSQRFDIVHSHAQTYHRAARAAHRAGIPVHVTTDHGRPVPDPLSLRVRDILYLPWVDKVIAVSDDLASYLHRRVFIPWRKITTIPNGVDVKRFHPATQPNERMELHREWQVPADTLVVGSVGRQADVKNYPLLIEACALAESRGCRLLLVIVGDGPAFADNKQLAAQLSASVLFLGSRADVPSLLRGFDIFTLTSNSEGQSIAIMEAQATGLGVVATNVGGNKELIVDGETGRLMNSKDPEVWATLLCRLQSDRKTISNWGTAARQYAETHFGLDVVAQKYELLYAELAAAKGLVFQ